MLIPTTEMQDDAKKQLQCTKIFIHSITQKKAYDLASSPLFSLAHCSSSSSFLKVPIWHSSCSHLQKQCFLLPSSSFLTYTIFSRYSTSFSAILSPKKRFNGKILLCDLSVDSAFSIEDSFVPLGLRGIHWLRVGRRIFCIEIMLMKSALTGFSVCHICRLRRTC